MPSTRPTVDPVLDILEELGYDFDELDGDGYKRSLKEAIIKLTIKDAKDPRIEPLTLELQKVKGSRKVEPKEKPKEKRTTIRGDKLMGREPKKDAPSTADKPKLLPGSGKFNTDDVKPADVDKDKKKDSSGLNPDKLDSIAKTVESIALLLRRQFNLEKKQQRDSRRQQSKDDRDAREDKLEGKPKDKKTGLLPKAIKKPALSFFDKIKNFFLNIVLGASVIKIMEWLKDPANAEKITKFKDFLIDNAPLILGGLAAIALLPIVGGLVGLVGGIMGGLSMLGLAVPLLPIILKGILIAAVIALTLAAGNAIKNKITQSISGGSKFKELDDRAEKQLREAGLGKVTNVGAGKHSAQLLGPDGKPIWVNMFGKDSLTGREWNSTTSGGIGKNHREQLTIGNPVHEEYIERTMGKDKLEEYKSAMNLYNRVIFEEKDPIKKQMGDELEVLPGQARRKIIDERADSQELADIKAMPRGLGKWEQNKARTAALKKYENETVRLSKEAQLAEEKRIREKYDKIIMEKFPEYFGKIDSSATIDKNIKTDTKNISASTKKGTVTVIDGGNASSGGTVGDSSGGGSGSGEEDDTFSSEDPNDLAVVASKATYNLGAA